MGVATVPDHAEATGTPDDYSAGFSRLVEALVTVSECLSAIEQLLVLRQDTEYACAPEARPLTRRHRYCCWCGRPLLGMLPMLTLSATLPFQAAERGATLVLR